MVLIVFTASVIQLPPRKTSQHGLDVPNRYKKIKTKMKAMSHDFSSYVF